MTYRNPELRWLLPATAVLLGGAGWAIGSVLGWVVVAAVWLLLAVSLYRVRVESDLDGAYLVNYVRSVYLPWGEVDAVQIDDSRTRAVFRMASGETLDARALSALGVGRGASRVRTAVAALEAQRRRYRGPRAHYPSEDVAARRVAAFMKRRPGSRGVAFGALVAGVAVLGVGTALLVTLLAYARDGVAESAVVTAVSPAYRDWSVTVSYPVEGRSVTATLDGWVGDPPEVGAVVEVAYLATHPSEVTDARMAGTPSGYGLAVGTMALGGGAAIYGAVAGARWWRRARHRPRAS